jgi:hypothetical protein
MVASARPTGTFRLNLMLMNARWLGSPNTAYLYDWNILPIGQLLWEKELMSH